jgi:hypothetical protein
MLFYTLMLLCLLLPGLTGCFFSAHGKSTVGAPLDREKAAQIQPGITSLKEVLSWFGPPDFIIDGTQRIPNAEAIVTAYGSKLWPIIPWSNAIKPRSLTSPEGTVLCIYQYIEYAEKADFGGIIAIGGGGPREGELFVFVAKDTLVVTDVAFGNPP